MDSKLKKMSTSKRMGLGFTGALGVAGVLFYFAKRTVASRRKADLDEYRTGSEKKRIAEEDTKTGP